MPWIRNLCREPQSPRHESISVPCQELGRIGATGGLRNAKGMNVAITSLFIIGETAGGGLVALPTAMSHCGILLGTLIIILCAFICGYTGVQLADCWSILLIRYPEYSNHTHKPYPAIGKRACGRNVGIAVSVILNITQFGIAVVFLLLASKNIASFIVYVAGVHISFCWVIGVVAVALFPLILLRSPKDFWMCIVVAMITTTGSCVLLIYGASRDAPLCMPANERPDFELNRVLQTFGTVMFSYGGHPAFPTIQHDMREPHKFGRAVIGAFIGISMMYLPVSIVGALVYGSSLGDVVIFSIQDPSIQQAINMLITVHVFLALTIFFNPMNQEAEKMFGVPALFTLKRVFVRGCVLAAVVFVALTIPNFGPLLELVGASTVTLMAIVFPSLFALYLNARLSKFGTKSSDLELLHFSDLWKHNRGRKFFLNICLIIFGILCGGYSSWIAIENMTGMNFQRPCYADLIFKPDAIEINAHADNSTIPLAKKFMCCGPYGNISALGAEYCLDRSTIANSGSHG